PIGPYYLCGYSFGGLVAFEIARRLSESGNEVGFVGLFDTFMSSLRWRLRAWRSIVRRRIPRLRGNLRVPQDNSSLPDLPSVLPTRVARGAARALLASARYT